MESFKSDSHAASYSFYRTPKLQLTDKNTSDLTLLSHKTALTKAINIDKLLNEFAETNIRVFSK